MKLIIDTHIFLWVLASPEKIAEDRLRILESRANTVYVSAITITELMIKSSIGKFHIDFNPVDLARQSGFDLHPFSAEEALLLKELPFHHKDPFDRMLIAQSIASNRPIMTDDEKFSLYECEMI